MLARLRFALAVLLVGAAIVLPAPAARADVIYASNFDANDGGLTPSVVSGFPMGPFTYGPTAGVGGGGAWFTNGIDGFSDKVLTSPALTVTGTGSVSITFDHRFNFENNFDGGQLQVSVNNGAFTTVPEASFGANGYNSTIAFTGGSPIGGQRAWSGASAGYGTPAYITSMASLGTFNAGDTLAFRFLGVWDGDTVAGAPNWVIDNVTVTDSGLITVPVPEPASLVLVLAGLTGLATRVRRRR